VPPSPNVPANWGTNTIPVVGDDVDFSLPFTYTITLSNNRAFDRIFQSAGTVSLLSSSGSVRTIDLTTGGMDLIVRTGGTLNIGSAANSVFLTAGDRLLIATGPGVGNGDVVVNGAGSRLDALGTGVQSIASAGHTGTLDIINGATANIGTNGTLDVGNSSNSATNAFVTVSGGSTFNTGNLNIANNTNSTSGMGTMTITGSSSTITQTLAGADLTIGSASGGTGTLIIESGGTFTTGTGTTTINATGTVNVGLIGGTFNANGPMIIDGGTLERSALATFNLASGLTLTASNDAQVNFFGLGGYNINNGTTLEINSGADFFAVGLKVGISSGNGTLVVDGEDSTVISNGNDAFGFNGNTANVTFRNQATGTLQNLGLADANSAGGTGTLAIESGATVTTGNLTVAVGSGATTMGMLTIEGTNSSLTQNGASNLTVGHASSGSATIDIQDGGTFTTGTGTTTINPTGTVNVGLVGGGGGAFNANGPMNIDGGTVNLASGALSAGTITLNSGNFNFTGGTLSVETFDGDLTVQGSGILAPGNSPGTTSVTGNYDQQAGTLEIELGGLTAGTEFDQLVVTGMAMLAGSLEVSIIDSFVPNFGDVFKIVDAGSLSGQFAGLAEGTTLTADGVELEITYLSGGANEVELTVTGFTLSADFDLDTDVDGIDLSIWEAGFGSGTLHAEGDTDGDDNIGGADFLAWQRQFGSGVGALSSSTTGVPEPSTGMLLLTAAFALIGRHGRRNSRP